MSETEHAGVGYCGVATMEELQQRTSAFPSLPKSISGLNRSAVSPRISRASVRPSTACILPWLLPFASPRLA